MKPIALLIAGVGLVTLITGCASTDMTSFRDPAFSSKSFKRIAVVVSVRDLKDRQYAEKMIAQRITDVGGECVPSVTILLPTRTYTTNEIEEALQENGVDGVLILAFTDAGTKTMVLPGSSSIEGNATLSGNMVSYSETTQYSGPSIIHKPWVKSEIRLYERTTGKVAWMSSSSTGGNAYAGWTTLIDSIANGTAKELKKAGLLR